MRHLVLAFAMVAAPLAAQDPGVRGMSRMDRGEVSPPAAAVPPVAQDGPSPERSRQICLEARRLAKAGSDDPRIPGVLELCRRAGY